VHGSDDEGFDANRTPSETSYNDKEKKKGLIRLQLVEKYKCGEHDGLCWITPAGTHKRLTPNHISIWVSEIVSIFLTAPINQIKTENSFIKYQGKTTIDAPPTTARFAKEVNNASSITPHTTQQAAQPNNQTVTFRWDPMSMLAAGIMPGMIPGMPNAPPICPAAHLLPALCLHDFLGKVQNERNQPVMQYETVLRENALEPYQLPSLEDRNWAEMQVKLGHRLLLSQEAKKYMNPFE